MNSTDESEKMKKILLLAMTIVLCLTSCEGEKPGVDSSENVSSEPTYVPGDPTTVPDFLTEIPETWVPDESVETLLSFHEITDGYCATYQYRKENKKLYRIWMQYEDENYAEGMKELSQEELQKKSDDFVSSRIPVTFYTERATEKGPVSDQTAENIGETYKFRYWLPTPEELPYDRSPMFEFGEAFLEMDCYGNMIHFRNDYREGMESVKFPVEYLDEMMQEVRSKPEYAEFLAYKENPPENGYVWEYAVFDTMETENDEQPSLAVYVKLEAETIDEVLYHKIYCFPFSDYE